MCVSWSVCSCICICICVVFVFIFVFVFVFVFAYPVSLCETRGSMRSPSSRLLPGVWTVAGCLRLKTIIIRIFTSSLISYFEIYVIWILSHLFHILFWINYLSNLSLSSYFQESVAIVILNIYSLHCCWVCINHD